MAGLPIDGSRLALIAMSAARPGASFAELADGSTKFVPGQQGIDRDTGLPTWDVDCVVPADADDERGRMTTMTVRIVAQTAPQVQLAQPITFVDLVARPAVNKKTGQAVCYWSAAGVAASATARFTKSENAA